MAFIERGRLESTARLNLPTAPFPTALLEVELTPSQLGSLFKEHPYLF